MLNQLATAYRTRSGSALAASAAFFIAAHPACAQEADAPATEAASDGGEIVVTAQKREESLQKVPISIAVLSGAALDKQTAGGSLEALNAVPGMGQVTAPAGGMTSLTMRGVAPAGFFGSGTSTVAYYLDTIPFQLVRNAMVPNIKSFDMSRMEVLRGPQGTLYGASALNGVVRILTNDADPSRFELKARGGVSVTEGGDPSFRADAAVNVPLIQDKLAVRIVGGVEALGGWIEQPARNKQDANSSLSRSLRIKLAATPTDDLRIDLSAWFSRDQYDAASYADNNGNQGTQLAQPGTTHYDAYSARIVYDLPFMSVSSSTSYLKFEQEMYTDFKYNNPTSPLPYQLYTKLPAKVFVEELLLNSAAGGSTRWSAGLFYRDAGDDRYQTNPQILAGTLYWLETSKSYAIFGQVTQAFADGRFELTGGLRYFHDKSEVTTPAITGGFLTPGVANISSEAVTPRAAVTWLPGRNFTAYASYSQGFRAGLTQMPLVLTVAPIPPIKSDTINNFEIGSKGNLFGGLLSFDLAAYYIKWTNVQTAVTLFYGPPGAQGTVAALVNGSSASGFGADISLALQPARGVQVGGSLSVNDLKLDGPIIDRGVVLYNVGDRLAFSAKYTAAGHLSYDFPLTDALTGKVKVTLDYRSKQYQRILGAAVGNNVNLPGCGRSGVNSVCYGGAPLYLNANFDIVADSGKTLSIYGQNLTNWSGLLMPSFNPTAPFRPRPRTIGIQFEAKF